MVSKLAIISLLLIVMACVPIPPPDTTVTDCYGFTDGNTIVSSNHCLRAPYTDDNENPIIQAVPDGWQIVNVLQNADGFKDEFTDYARITPNGFGLTFYLHNSVDGINGKWGYSQDVELPPGCHLLKVTGQNGVNDPLHPNDFVVSGYVDDVLISQQVIPAQSGFELIYPFKTDVPAIYTIKWMVAALWGVAGHNSKIDILGAGVLSVGDGYCGN